MIYIYNAIIIGLTFALIKKKGVLLSPSCIFYWISFFNYIALQMVFSGITISPKILYKLTGTYYSAMPVNFSQASFNAAILQYFILLIFGCVLTIYYSKKQEKQFELNFSPLKQITKNPLMITIALIIMNMIYIIHFFSIDLNLLWQNHSYLLLETPSRIGINNGILKIIHFSLRIVGLFTAGLTMHFFFNRSYMNLFLSSLIFMYALIFMLAQNSRWASLYFFMMLLYCQITKHWNWKGKTILALMCLLTFIKVIEGRGEYDQGIVAIWSGYSNIRLDVLYYYLLGFLLNILEGATSFANAEQIAPVYALHYKVLAFSPFPSFIDGFSSILKLHEVRINHAVPFSAISEVRWFGGIFFILFYTTIGMLLKYANQAYYHSKGIIPFFLSGFIFWITFTINSYPVRNTYRSILIMLFLLFILQRIKTSREKNLQENRLIEEKLK